MADSLNDFIKKKSPVNPLARDLTQRGFFDTWTDFKGANQAGVRQSLPMPVAREEVGSLESGAKKLGAGALQLGGALSGFASGAADVLGLEDAHEGMKVMQRALNNQAAKWLQETGGTQSFIDGDSSIRAKYQRGELEFGDAVNAITDLALTQAPQLMMGAGSAKVGAQLLTPLVSSALPKLGAKGAAYLAGLTGSTAFMGAQETGSIYGEQEEKDFGRALAYGLPAGALEAAGQMIGMGRAGVGGFIAKELAQTGRRSAAKIGKDILAATASEGATEASQSILEQAGAKTGTSALEALKKTNWSEVAESAAAGAVMGGGMTTATAPMQSYLAKVTERKQKELEELLSRAKGAKGEVAARVEQDIAAGTQSASLLKDGATLEEGRRAESDRAKVLGIEDQTLEAAEALELEATEEASVPEPAVSAASAIGVEPKVLHTAAQALYRTVKSYAEFAKGLVAQFGAKAKQFALKLWNAYKGSALADERGSFSLEDKHSLLQRAEQEADAGTTSEETLQALREAHRAAEGPAKELIAAMGKQYAAVHKASKAQPTSHVSPEGGPVQYVNHSGGAKGSDSVWGQIGEEYGVASKHYHAEGQKTPTGNTPISQADLKKADPLLAKANKTLKRKFPTRNDYVNNLLRRNASQVGNADSVFAIGNITASGTEVEGGTGWAVQMAIDAGKPVYVFNQKDNKFYEYDGTVFIETETPRLTPNFAGIGTREISAAGKKAIRSVYQKTFGETDSETQPAPQQNPELEKKQAYQDKLRKDLGPGTAPPKKSAREAAIPKSPNKRLSEYDATVQELNYLYTLEQTKEVAYQIGQLEEYRTELYKRIGKENLAAHKQRQKWNAKRPSGKLPVSPRPYDPFEGMDPVEEVQYDLDPDAVIAPQKVKIAAQKPNFIKLKKEIKDNPERLYVFGEVSYPKGANTLDNVLLAPDARVMENDRDFEQNAKTIDLFIMGLVEQIGAGKEIVLANDLVKGKSTKAALHYKKRLKQLRQMRATDKTHETTALQRERMLDQTLRDTDLEEERNLAREGYGEQTAKEDRRGEEIEKGKAVDPFEFIEDYEGDLFETGEARKVTSHTSDPNVRQFEDEKLNLEAGPQEIRTREEMLQEKRDDLLEGQGEEELEKLETEWEQDDQRLFEKIYGQLGNSPELVKVAEPTPAEKHFMGPQKKRRKDTLRDRIMDDIERLATTYRVTDIVRYIAKEEGLYHESEDGSIRHLSLSGLTEYPFALQELITKQESLGEVEPVHHGQENNPWEDFQPLNAPEESYVDDAEGIAQVWPGKAKQAALPKRPMSPKEKEYQRKHDRGEGNQKVEFEETVGIAKDPKAARSQMEARKRVRKIRKKVKERAKQADTARAEKAYALWQEETELDDMLAGNAQAFFVALNEQARKGINQHRTIVDFEAIAREMSGRATIEFRQLPLEKKIEVAERLYQKSNLLKPFESQYHRSESVENLEGFSEYSAVEENIDQSHRANQLGGEAETRLIDKSSEGMGYQKTISHTRGPLYAVEFKNSQGKITKANVTPEALKKLSENEDYQILKTEDLGEQNYLEQFEWESDVTDTINLAIDHGVFTEVAKERGYPADKFRAQLLQWFNTGFRTGNHAASIAARKNLYRELAYLRAAVLSKQFAQGRLLPQDTFEKLAKEYPDLNKTPGEIYGMFMRIGRKDALVQTLERELRERREMEAHQRISAAYRGFNDGTTSGADLVKEMLPKDRREAYERFVASAEERAKAAPEDKDLFEALADYAARIEAARRKGEKPVESLATLKKDRGLAVTAKDFTVLKKKVTDYEQTLKERGVPVLELTSQVAHTFYRAVAKIFGADLVIVGGNTKSRYQGRSFDGRPKIIINAEGKTSIARIFAHEMFHHLVNKAAPSEYEAFRKAIIEVIENDETLTKTFDKGFGIGVKLQKLKAVKTPLQEGDSRQAAAQEMIDSFRFGSELEQEEFLAELFADVAHRKEFYQALAKTLPGKTLSAKIIKRFADMAVKLNTAAKSDKSGFVYEKTMLIGPEAMQEVTQLTADLVGHAYRRRTDPTNHSESRFFTPIGYASARELIGYAKATFKWLGGIWRKIFPKGTRNHRALMDNLQELIKSGIEMVKKAATKGIFTDFMTSIEDFTFAHLVAHGPVHEVAQLQAQLINKHKGVFDRAVTKKIEELKKRIEAGRMQMGKTKDGKIVYLDPKTEEGQAKARELLAMAPDIYREKFYDDVVRAELDVATEEGRQAILELGYDQEVIDALTAYQGAARKIYDQLKEFMPELPEVATHYGLSIRWRSNGNPLEGNFDWSANPEYSRFEGAKKWAKDRNKTLSTRELAEKYKIKYDTLDPEKMLLNYAMETYRLIYFRKAMHEGSKHKEPSVQVFKNEIAASEAGYATVHDNATKILQQMDVPLAYRIQQKNGTFLQKDGKDVVLTRREEAQELAQRVNGTLAEVTPDSFISRTSYTVYEIKNGRRREIRTFVDKRAADEFAATAEDYQVKPDFAEAKYATVGQVYFKKDLARMLNTLVARNDLLEGSFAGISGKGLMNLKNKYTSIEFALSMFHFVTITQELIASYSTWTLMRRLRSKNKPGLLQTLGGYNPRKAFRESRELAVLLEEVLADPNLAANKAVQKKASELMGVDNIDLLEMIRQFYLSGGLMHQDKSLRSDLYSKGEMRYTTQKGKLVVEDGEAKIIRGKFSPKAMKDSIKEVWEKETQNYPNHPLKNLFTSGQYAVMEGTTQWLMEQTIPKIKLSQFAREYALTVELKADLLASGQTTHEAIGRDTMKFIEDRFGEVNWQNMWMHPNVKTALQFAFRSFTWFTGSWKALGKAGIDVGKLGWFTVKDLGAKNKVHYQLTEKGWWGFNAFVAHFLTVGLISSVYALSAPDDEAETDEDVPLLTRMLFPRIDPYDPSRRVLVPSYISEAYKIAQHIGLLGSEAEYTKLVSGRFNSLIGKGLDLYHNEDFRGTTIANHDDNLVQQNIDRFIHIMPLPIFFSVFAKGVRDKGFDPVDLAFAAFGTTEAPAGAKRSHATNLAFEQRRKEYKGKAISKEEMAVKDALKRAAYAYQKGDQGPIDKLRREGVVSAREVNNAIAKLPLIKGKKNPLYTDRLSQAIKGLTIEGAIKVWNAMSENEKKKHRHEIVKKYMNVMKRHDRSTQEKIDLRNELKHVGILS